jgi:hypothetical protein
MLTRRTYNLELAVLPPLARKPAERRIHPGDEVGSLLLRSVEQDRKLYD